MDERKLITASLIGGKIMVGPVLVSSRRRSRHLKVYDIDGRPYVYIGRRKEYVTGHKVILADPLVVKFYTRGG